MTSVTSSLFPTNRDRELLTLLDRTPATTAQILMASETFTDGPYRGERRVRERLQTLAEAGLVRSWPLALPHGGATNCYKLTPEAFRLLHGEHAAEPHKRYFAPIPLGRLQHTYTLAEVIVHTLVAAHRHRVAVIQFYRENALTLRTGVFEQQPDCMFQLSTSGRVFNVLFEIDNSSESVDAVAHQSIRQKILGYEAYQDHVWQAWNRQGRQGSRPYFRVAFLTRTIDRAHHILTLAGQLARNRHRRLCYAATQDAYLAERDVLREPLFLDHHGHWQSLVNIHPTSAFPKPPVRLETPVAQGMLI